TSVRLRNQLIYSVFVRDYGKNGTFNDVTKDLQRIKMLGTDMIWLMPIHPIGETGRKGREGSPYAIKDYRAVNPSYGTMKDFIHLTEEIHRLNMKCIIDVVYNHTSPDSVLAKEHPEWFHQDEDGKPIARVKEWWDIVDLDYKHKELWDYQIETLQFWAKYVDGFRCDVAPFVPLEFWQQARSAVEKVRPGAYWLAESVEPQFIRNIRSTGELCLSDSELYQVFDACYDYDIYHAFSDYLLGTGSLEKYLYLLNLQESIYPENYIKLHFTENHDRTRTAALIPDLRRRKHVTAFSLFQKGAALIYNGQEYSADEYADIFEKKPIDRSKDDISDLIFKMSRIKKLDISAFGSFTATEISEGMVCAVYTYGEKKMIGLFSIGSKAAAVNIGLPDGSYLNEYDNKKIYINDGIIPVYEDPVIIIT
ncbi:MAG: alpha-amylase, partial [Lachnospiraceae bacterium]|nr:alpha-amylase [Lachnospiraceae bacterium]